MPRLLSDHSLVRALLCALLTLVLAACSTTKEPDPTEGWTAEQLYAAARSDLDDGRYADAVKYLQKLEARYPFGKLAEQARLDTAWAHYKDNERGLSLAAIDRFLKMYPNHSDVDYVHYLKGLVNFNDRNRLLASLGAQNLSERDMQAARESFDSFRTVVTRFPESRYAADSRQRMRYLVNAMAAGEVSVARYYYHRGAFVAAANRAQAVVKQYSQVPAIEEALYILMASYKALGLDELSDGADRVLAQNFPDSTLREQGLVRDTARWWEVWR